MSIETTMTALADVIRRKTGKTGTMTIEEMTQTLAECKTLGFAEVNGTVTNASIGKTLTISGLPFDEIFAVYVHDTTHTRSDNSYYYLLSTFSAPVLGMNVTHFNTRSKDEVYCYNSALPTYSNGTLTITPGACTSDNLISGNATFDATSYNPDFSTGEFAYYICGSLA